MDYIDLNARGKIIKLLEENIRDTLVILNLAGFSKYKL